VEEITMGMMIGVIAVVVIGLLPIIFRLSRALWISIFIRYEGPSSQIPKKSQRFRIEEQLAGQLRQRPSSLFPSVHLIFR
jgi:hypothetical protein